MSSWTTPKTDWNSSQQGVTDTDFNRIEGNTQYLYETPALDLTSIIAHIGGVDSNSGTSAVASFTRKGNTVFLNQPADIDILIDSAGAVELYLGDELSLLCRPDDNSVSVIIELYSADPSPFSSFSIGTLEVVSSDVDSWEGKIVLNKLQEVRSPFEIVTPGGNLASFRSFTLTYSTVVPLP